MSIKVKKTRRTDGSTIFIKNPSFSSWISRFSSTNSLLSSQPSSTAMKDSRLCWQGKTEVDAMTSRMKIITNYSKMLWFSRPRSTSWSKAINHYKKTKREGSSRTVNHTCVVNQLPSTAASWTRIRWATLLTPLSKSTRPIASLDIQPSTNIQSTISSRSPCTSDLI